ncbi:aldehyde dehydrogenase family protein [Fodinicola feengrottensis]|uniref:aldehyde dehydrogenase family protein n=1 Tax=Fodinicola feengrottensis TaxID=435914 RepID=UPI0024422EB9|nr:aldehyde dehydrogenase family protein [Fodinicola feengrottensis]
MTSTAAVGTDYDRLYIGGEWVPPVEPGIGSSVAVHSPTTELQIGRIPMAGKADADRAVRAASAAFPDWMATPLEERLAALERISAALYARMPALTELITHDLGMPHDLCALTQVAMPAETFAITARMAREFPFQERLAQSIVWREPVGVVGAITPWNFPLAEIASKAAAALAVGCTVVVKPSDLVPLAAFALAEVIDECGLPPGRLQPGVRPRRGRRGDHLPPRPGHGVLHRFGRGGRRVAELAAGGVKRVSLELGGKSANLLFPDADFEKAVPDGIFKAFLNSGQVCSALSRLVVPRERLTEVEELARTTIADCPVGDPFDPASKLGPLASAGQRDRVLRYVHSGLYEGARLVVGGPDRPAGLDRGHFVAPTVFSDVRPEMTIAREEIFGPVLAILPYDSEEEGIAIAMDTSYGLAASVWTADTDRALGLARRFRVGQVEINGGVFDPLAPFGGYRQSGYGRAGGKFGLEPFVEIKSLLVAPEGQP